MGARLLDLQGDDGSWGGVAWNWGWSSTMHVLMLLREMGLDSASDPACKETGLVTRLLAEQLPGGGWNCEAANGSPRSSFNTTICVLEALLEHERVSGGVNQQVSEARLRGQEYLLERRLFRRRSTGEVIERDRKGGTTWRDFAFPTWWHYDVLRGLDYLRCAGVAPDERVAEAIALVVSKRDREGRWPHQKQYTRVMPVEIDDGEGQPSRWNTLRALRVLKWHSAGS